MKVKILKKEPNRYLVQHLDTGRISAYPKLFFKKRVEMGVIETEDKTSFSSII